MATKKQSLSYQDFLRQQALQELEALGTQSQFDPGSFSTKQGAAQQQPQGTQSMLSQDGPITENYGDIQPGVELFSGGFTNGTGIGVPKGTQVSLPPVDEWQVVNSYAEDPYQGYIGDGTNSGYGNSALVRNTKTGETLRFSHLARNDVQTGQTLKGGTPLGLTGDTGNASGPHLNLEYYDPNGQLNDVLQSGYARYLFGNSSGKKSSGKGGGNPLQGVVNGAVNMGKNFLKGYQGQAGQGVASGDMAQNLGDFVGHDSPAGPVSATIGAGLGLGAKALGAAHFLPAMAGFVTQYNKAMPQPEINDALSALDRYHFNQGDINYMMKQGANDENTLRHYAATYINNKFGNNAPIQDVKNELLNRIQVDRGSNIDTPSVPNTPPQAPASQAGLYDTPQVLYHGTSKKAADAIRKEGFKLPNNQSLGVSLSDELNMAKNYGEDVVAVRPKAGAKPIAVGNGTNDALTGEYLYKPQDLEIINKSGKPHVAEQQGLKRK